MNSQKSALRKQLKQRRLEMLPAEHTLQSRAIVERLKQAADWPQIKALHFFEPIHELMEVEILDFIAQLQDNCPDLRLATSRKIGEAWELVSLDGDVPPQQFDVIIVPMLGFDKSLQRIGYGGGYYDKFLASQPQAQKIGVCFEQGKVERVPTEPHDVPLDLILTESARYA